MSNGLLVVVLIMQVTIVLWLIGITSVFQDMLESSERRARTYSKTQKTVLKAVKAVVDEAEYYDRKLEDYKDSIAADAEQAKMDKLFAMSTIRQARRLQNIEKEEVPDGQSEDGNSE